MDDRMFIGVMIYLVLSVLTISTLPSSFFSGSKPTLPDTELGIDDPTSVTGQIGFFKKLILFSFVPFAIDGIPIFIGLMILILNLFSTMICIIWIYDKIRGIGG